MTEVRNLKILEFEDKPHLKKICFECSPENGQCRSAIWDNQRLELTISDMTEGKYVSSVTISAEDLDIISTFLEHILPDLLDDEEIPEAS